MSNLARRFVWNYFKRTTPLFNRVLFLFLMSAILFGCIPSSNDVRKAGIAISFDDHFIKDWYALRPMFKKYNAKVTFFITCSDSLNSEEITLLKQLESEGHEIGFHGTIHGRATDLIAAHGPQGYIDTELAPGLGYLAAAGFKPTSYAHPGGNHNARVDSVLLSNGFKILRDVAISRRKYSGIPLYIMAPRIMPWIYYSFNKNPIVDALLIDTDSELTMPEMKEAIATAKSNGTALMIFGHQPLKHEPVNGAYGFDIQFLENILREASQQGLKYYTMSELVE